MPSACSLRMGGSDALIVRVGGAAATRSMTTPSPAPRLEPAKRGLWALDKAKCFNLLCISPLADGKDIGPQTPPPSATSRKARAPIHRRPERCLAKAPSRRDRRSWTPASRRAAGHVALFFPSSRRPIRRGRGKDADCRAVRRGRGRQWRATDAVQRAPGRPPAGIEATLKGVPRPGAQADRQPERRALMRWASPACAPSPAPGSVELGARTLAGAHQAASEWKYIPVRRLAFFIEESIQRGIRWAVFEPSMPSRPGRRSA